MTGRLGAVPRPSAQTKRALAEARTHLREAYLRQPHSARLLRAHAKLVDNTLEQIWLDVDMPEQATLAAVGGYGRGELYPYSDVDVLVLLPGEADAALQDKMACLVGLWWDSGLEVGHSVRTIAQCVEEARQDVTVQTNLLEARLLCGSKALFEQFRHTVRNVLDVQAFCNAKLLEQQQRHARYHDSASSLEPHLKESPGGLRDLQTILWISGGAGLGNTWRALAQHDLITVAELRQIRRHETLLQNLRIRLHYLANRREDRLLFDFQAALAQQFGLHEESPRRASEQLMQRYYRTAKAVGLYNTMLLQSLRARLFPGADGEAHVINERFCARQELLEARSSDLFERTPSAILESFLLLEQHPELKGMSADTLRSLWRARHRIDTAFRRDPANRALFMQILRQPQGITQAFRRMNQYGVLASYLPPFGRITGQMQHDLFHVYTVDEHTLKVLRNLRRFTVAEFAHEFPLCSRLISGFARPETLYLAALFHDIAKGRGGDHSRLGKVDAYRFCRKHGLPKEDTDLVVWLVERHLLMSATAQKQDITDPETVAAFAAQVGDERRLIALYLLTVADIRGTSPKVWNAWKGKLLEDLFWATRRHLGGDAATPQSSLQSRQTEALQKLRLYALGENAHQELWSKLDTSYFLRHEAQEIAWHTRLLYYRVDTTTPVVKARLSPAGEGLQVMIYSADQKDLFARICGFFERINYSIAEAKIHTTRHNYALDSFQVMDPTRKTVHYRDLINYIEYELGECLTRQMPLAPPAQGRLSRLLKHFPITPEVDLHADDKGQYQVLSIVAGDRPGLLSRIARVLVSYGINLHSARIATLGERAEDTFLITGDMLNDAKAVLRFEGDLLAALQT
ncbi:MAG: [protein-PII] uridylyltransferase [Pseudomonadota bacterium]